MNIAGPQYEGKPRLVRAAPGRWRGTVRPSCRKRCVLKTSRLLITTEQPVLIIFIHKKNIAAFLRTQRSRARRHKITVSCATGKIGLRALPGVAVFRKRPWAREKTSILGRRRPTVRTGCGRFRTRFSRYRFDRLRILEFAYDASFPSETFPGVRANTFRPQCLVSTPQRGISPTLPRQRGAFCHPNRCGAFQGFIQRLGQTTHERTQLRLVANT